MLVVIIDLMMVAANTFETSLKFYQIVRLNKPEHSHLQVSTLQTLTHL
jgi:hypothetical protein